MVNATNEVASAERAGVRAFPGFRLRMVARTPSTQDVVRAAARAGALPGFCCVAGEQTSGRGRQGRSWTAPVGSALLCSTLLRVRHDLAGGVPLAAGLAVHAALRDVGVADLRLKWPNDVLAGGRKLAGILCEVEPLAPGVAIAVVVGIGVNLRNAAVPDTATATSVEDLVGNPPTAVGLLAKLLPALSAVMAQLAALGTPGLRDLWIPRSTGLGSAVRAATPGGEVGGVAEGIDDDGALLIRTSGVTVRVLAGDVHLLPPPAS